MTNGQRDRGHSYDSICGYFGSSCLSNEGAQLAIHGNGLVMTGRGSEPGEKRSQLSFSLYGAANRMMRLHKPLLDPLGLTFPQYLVILELLDGAPVPVGILGARLGMVDLTQRGRAIETQVRGVTDQIITACRMTDQDMEHLRLTLEALGHPVAG